MATIGISGTSTSSVTQYSPENSEKQAVISQLQLSIQTKTEDTVDVSGVTDQLSKNLSVLAQQVLDKLNQSVGNEIPGGIASLKPEDHTPEKTAQSIVDGVSGLFSVYAQQNKDLTGDQLVTKFLETIRGGIEKGYGQADKILGDAGAFQLSGIKDGIEETKKLVEQKLQALEDKLRGKDSAPQPAASGAPLDPGAGSASAGQSTADTQPSTLSTLA